MMQRLPTAALLGVMILGSIPEARPEAWVEVTTPALTVVSDGSEKEARNVAARFEEIRALLKEA